jgi:hypothetical protein
MAVNDRLSPMQRVQQNQEREAKLCEDRRRFALQQGYLLVQVSPRRFSVAKLTSYGGFYGHRLGTFASMNAETVFGPATWAACRDFIAENADPLPPELCK